MDLKNLILYIAILLFFIKFNPFLPFGLPLISAFMDIAGIVSAAYITIFTIYMTIKNFNLIQFYINKLQYNITKFIGEQSFNQKTDFVKFLFLSIIIIFCIDIIFYKIGEQSFIQYMIKYIPGLQETIDVINYSPTELNFTNIVGLTDPKTMDVKFENIQQVITFVIGPSLGSIILLVLRNLSYRSKSMNESKNPGSRILIIFFVIASITLLLDLSKSLNQNFNLEFNDEDFLLDYNNQILSFSELIDNRENTVDTVYGVEETVKFFIKLLLNPFFFIYIISLWVLDRYLFSKLWEVQR